MNDCTSLINYGPCKIGIEKILSIKENWLTKFAIFLQYLLYLQVFWPALSFTTITLKGGVWGNEYNSEE